MNSMRRVVGWAAVVVLMGCNLGRAAEFHVSTAQELQNALTEAAGNGEDNTIYLAAGYYVGNFNFNSAQANSLTIQAAAGVQRTEVTIDGDGAGRSMSLTLSGVGDLTVRGITVLRNCGAADRAGLRLSAGRDIFVDDCRFMAGDTHRGMGVEIVAARDATVENSLLHGETGSQGRGMSCSEVSGEVRLRLNTFSGNWYPSSGVHIGGAGLFVRNVPSVLLEDTTFLGNVAHSNTGGGGVGGGLYATDVAALQLRGNTFHGNRSSSYGGGAYLRHDSGITVTLIENIFSQNSAPEGGGINIRATGAGASATLSRNVFQENVSPALHGAGGGASLNGLALMLNGNVFDGNSAPGGGGAYLSTKEDVTLTGNTFRNNHATNGSGGGLHESLVTGTGQNPMRLFNNLFHNNIQSGTGAGGGAYLRTGMLLTMVNNTLTANQAAGNGGGAFFQVDGTTEELHVFNNIIWGNTAAGSGSDVSVAGQGAWKEFSYNCAHDLHGVWDRAVHNVDVAPQFFDPVNKNFRLRHTSPCINVGTNGAPNLPDTDLDGAPRIVNETVDLGAYEFSNTDKHPADLNDNWTIEESEYTAYAAAWKNDQEWSRGPNPIPADFVTRAGYLLENGGAYHNEGSGGKPVCWKPGVAP